MPLRVLLLVVALLTSACAILVGWPGVIVALSVLALVDTGIATWRHQRTHWPAFDYVAARQLALSHDLPMPDVWIEAALADSTSSQFRVVEFIDDIGCARQRIDRTRPFHYHGDTECQLSPSACAQAIGQAQDAAQRAARTHPAWEPTGHVLDTRSFDALVFDAAGVELGLVDPPLASVKARPRVVRESRRAALRRSLRDRVQAESDRLGAQLELDAPPARYSLVASAQTRAPELDVDHGHGVVMDAYRDDTGKVWYLARR